MQQPVDLSKLLPRSLVQVQPKDIPRARHAVPPAAPLLPLTRSVPAPGARAGQRARPGDPARPESGDRLIAGAKPVP